MTFIITCGAWAAEITPAIGGGLASLRYGKTDILRPATPEALRTQNRLGLASFPLLPYPGRIRHGTFPHAGTTVTVPPNHPDFPYPLHGDGWLVAWDVVDHLLRPDSCTLRYSHKAAGWPWDYVADLTYSLTEDGLSMKLSVCNRSSTPMPAGLGQHPYFERVEGCRLTLQADTVLWPSEDMIADLVGPLPPEWGFASGHAVGSVLLDHGFAGWHGAATLTRPDFSYHILIGASDNASFLQLYLKDGEPFVCVEPMTCAANAVNPGPLVENGLTELAPGETAVLDTHIFIRPR